MVAVADSRYFAKELDKQFGQAPSAYGSELDKSQFDTSKLNVVNQAPFKSLNGISPLPHTIFTKTPLKLKIGLSFLFLPGIRRIYPNPVPDFLFIS